MARFSWISQFFRRMTMLVIKLSFRFSKEKRILDWMRRLWNSWSGQFSGAGLTEARISVRLLCGWLPDIGIRGKCSTSSTTCSALEVTDLTLPLKYTFLANRFLGMELIVVNLENCKDKTEQFHGNDVDRTLHLQLWHYEERCKFLRSRLSRRPCWWIGGAGQSNMILGWKRLNFPSLYQSSPWIDQNWIGNVNQR